MLDRTTEAKRAVLATFRRFRIDPGEYLAFQSLIGESLRWSDDLRQCLEAALAALKDDKVLESLDKPKGYRLLRSM